MERKVYGVHISQRNNIESVINEEFIKLAKSYEAVFVMETKDPVRYLGSFILPTRKEQRAFMEALSKRGIKAYADRISSRADNAVLEHFGVKWQEK